MIFFFPLEFLNLVTIFGITMIIAFKRVQTCRVFDSLIREIEVKIWEIWESKQTLLRKNQCPRSLSIAYVNRMLHLSVWSHACNDTWNEMIVQCNLPVSFVKWKKTLYKGSISFEEHLRLKFDTYLMHPEYACNSNNLYQTKSSFVFYFKVYRIVCRFAVLSECYINLNCNNVCFMTIILISNYT